MVSDRIAALRALMKKKGIDAYMIPTDDYHACLLYTSGAQ